ncbi:hypothetical protein QUF75_02040 [Desulfococcaceae bacterium HSG7]|nr:hypothetical protein [Desulfococcaceae bacterium HSG7]
MSERQLDFGCLLCKVQHPECDGCCAVCRQQCDKKVECNIAEEPEGGVTYEQSNIKDR